MRVLGGPLRPSFHGAVVLTAALTIGVSGLVASPVQAGSAGTSAVSSDGGDRPPLRLARSAGTPVRSLDVALTPSMLSPSGAGSSRTERLPTASYSMLGLTWHGGDEPEIRVRTRTGGAWRAWQAMPILHDGPDAGAGEGARDLVATEPVWVGSSDGVQVSVTGATPRDLELALIDPGTAPHDAAAATASSGGGPLARVAGTSARGAKKKSRPSEAPRPDILGRGKWGAKKAWRDGGPYYNNTIKQVHVHHTATGNGYSRGDVPGLIRGMYRYHTHNLGWSDIGYNFLVDRFGRTWLGRAGGAGKAVRGAHTLGFNHASTGVALIGNYEETKPTAKAKTAVVKLAAWKLDRYHRKPAGTAHVKSHGSDRFSAGRRVVLPVVDGHRDTNDTACPGSYVYRKLPALRSRAQRRVDRFDPAS